MYSVTKTGLAAEAYEIKGPPFRLVPIGKQRYSLLRPEAVESAFVLWRVTRKQEYRDFGWSVFQALEKHSRRKGAGRGKAGWSEAGRVASRPGRGGPGGETVADRGEAGRLAIRRWAGRRDSGGPGRGTKQVWLVWI